MQSSTKHTELNLSFEHRRLDVLRLYGVLDTPSEEVFDYITAAVSTVCKVP